ATALPAKTARAPENRALTPQSEPEELCHIRSPAVLVRLGNMKAVPLGRAEEGVVSRVGLRAENILQFPECGFEARRVVSVHLWVGVSEEIVVGPHIVVHAQFHPGR